MRTEKIFLCGGVKPDGGGGSGHALKLDAWERGLGKTVTLKIAAMNRHLGKNIAPVFHDLLEVAAYVWTADQMVGRGAKDVDTFGEKWRRTFEFHIPVRQLEVWKAAEVQKVLEQTLGFLSDDVYNFNFYPAKNPPEFQLYLNLGHADGSAGEIEQVMLFSGGLDSLSGGIEETLIQKRRCMWVSHRPTPKHNRRHREIDLLMGEKANSLRPGHVLVDINKDSQVTKETTQRPRSFLFAAVGAAVAQMLGLNSVRFYENGVVSLNLPMAEQVIGARSTRTTHPQVLKGFSKLMTLLSGGDFKVENPFLWETKGQVIERIVKTGCGPMIKSSVSCAHTHQASLKHPHCGVCSQCIDRRFGIAYAKAEEFDPLTNYKLEVFTKSRPRDEDKILGAAYLDRAEQFESIRDWSELMTEYPEVTDILPYLDMPAAKGAAKILDLCKKHGKEIRIVSEMMVERYAKDIVANKLDGDCLVRTMYESRGLAPSAATAIGSGEQTEPEGESKGGIHKIGRLEYRAGFEQVWLDGELYELSKRDKARLCIEFLVAKKSFDKKSACHFADEIDPYVRRHARLVALPSSSEPKLRQYFFPSKSIFAKLGERLVKSAGRGSGRYYLNVQKQ